LQKLQNFVTTNQTGFRKILKKYDKQLKSHTKEIYLSRKIEIQPVFNKNILCELSDKAAGYLQQLDFKEVDSDLYQYIHSQELLVNYLNTHHLLNAESVELPSESEKKREHAREQLSRVFLDSLLELQEEIVDLLLPIVNLTITEDSNDHSCLHIAAINGRLDLITKLIPFCDLNRLDFHQRSALHYGCMYGHESIVTLLLEADLALVDQDGITPMIYAIMGGHVSCVEILLNKTDVNGVKSTTAPLSIACQYGHLPIVEMLCEKGAGLAPNPDGLYPIHIACKNGHADIAKFLLENGSNVEEKDTFNGWSPLFFACSEGNLNCVHVLLENKCSLIVKDDQGWSPLTYALYRGKIEVAEFLSQYMTKPVEMESESVQGDTVMELTSKDTNMSAAETTLDLDDIPSLSLPPPIIPLRI
jgi:CDK inhibitor PHO81